jgi:hypothetical protein
MKNTILRKANSTLIWEYLILISLASAAAGEQASVNKPRHFDMQENGLLVREQDGPKRQLGEITGTLTSCDEISGKVSVRGIGESPMEFVLDTNTPITDHNLQIRLVDLRLGDQVTVLYNMDPRRVNSIKRI